MMLRTGCVNLNAMGIRAATYGRVGYRVSSIGHFMENMTSNMTWMAVTENLGYPPKVHVYIYIYWEKDDTQIRGYSIFGQTRGEEDPWFLQGKIKQVLAVSGSKSPEWAKWCKIAQPKHGSAKARMIYKKLRWTSDACWCLSSFPLQDSCMPWMLKFHPVPSHA